MYEAPPSFTPKINKPLKPKSGVVVDKKDVTSRLLEDGKAYKEKKEIASKQKEDTTDPELTFKPKVNNRQPKNAPQVPKWEHLHKMAEKYQRLRFDRELDAIEFTKEPHEYTFNPKIIGDNRPKMSKPAKEIPNES